MKARTLPSLLPASKHLQTSHTQAPSCRRFLDPALLAALFVFSSEELRSNSIRNRKAASGTFTWSFWVAMTHRRYTFVLWYLILLSFCPQDFLFPFVSRLCSPMCLQKWEISCLNRISNCCHHALELECYCLSHIMLRLGILREFFFFFFFFGGPLKLETQNAHQRKRISQFPVPSIVLSYLLCHPFRVDGDVCLHE